MYMLALTILTFLVSAFAQSLEILTPTANQRIEKGLFTVQVAMPVYILRRCFALF